MNNKVRGGYFLISAKVCGSHGAQPRHACLFQAGCHRGMGDVCLLPHSSRRSSIQVQVHYNCAWLRLWKLWKFISEVQLWRFISDCENCEDWYLKNTAKSSHLSGQISLVKSTSVSAWSRTCWQFISTKAYQSHPKISPNVTQTLWHPLVRVSTETSSTYT